MDPHSIESCENLLENYSMHARRLSALNLKTSRVHQAARRAHMGRPKGQSIWQDRLADWPACMLALGAHTMRAPVWHVMRRCAATRGGQT